MARRKWRLRPGSASATLRGQPPIDTLSIQKAALECDGNRMSAIIGLKFGEDISHMAFDGFFPNPHGRSDPFVRAAAGNPSEHFQFPLRQRIGSKILGNTCGHIVGYSAMTSVHPSDRIHEFLPHGPFQEIAERSRLQRARRLYIS